MHRASSAILVSSSTPAEGALLPLHAQPCGHARRHRAAHLRAEPVRRHENCALAERGHTGDVRPAELHLAREPVEDRRVRRGAQAHCFCLGLGCEARRLRLGLCLNLGAFGGRLSRCDDRVGLGVGGGL